MTPEPEVTASTPSGTLPPAPPLPEPPDDDDESDDDTEFLSEAMAEDESDRNWFHVIRGFIDGRLPVKSVDSMTTIETATISPAVEHAQQVALLAAFNAVTVILSRFQPEPTFTLDARHAGKDGPCRPR